MNHQSYLIIKKKAEKFDKAIRIINLLNFL